MIQIELSMNLGSLLFFFYFSYTQITTKFNVLKYIKNIFKILTHYTFIIRQIIVHNKLSENLD